MSATQEIFARVWYIGIALTPLLIAAWLFTRSRGTANRRHTAAIAMLLALIGSIAFPVLEDPGSWITSARKDFGRRGLAPCRAAAQSPITYSTLLPYAQDRSTGSTGCITLRYAAPWLIGCLIIASWHALGLLALRRILRRSQDAPTHLVQAVRTASDAIGVSPPTVQITHQMGSPFVTSGRRFTAPPILILPTPLLERLSRPELDAVLRHEIAHIQRADLLWARPVRVARVLFWWHPVVWLLTREVSRCAELSADRLAVDGDSRRARALASALLRTEANGVGMKISSATPASFALSRSGRLLAQRIQAMMRETTPSIRPAASYSSKQPMGMLATGLLAGLSVGFLVVQVALS